METGGSTQPLLFLLTHYDLIGAVVVVCLLYLMLRRRIFSHEGISSRHRVSCVTDPARRFAQMKEKVHDRALFDEEDLDVAVVSLKLAMGEYFRPHRKEEGVEWAFVRDIIRQASLLSSGDICSIRHLADILPDVVGTPGQSLPCDNLIKCIVGGDQQWDLAETYAANRISSCIALEDEMKPADSCLRKRKKKANQRDSIEDATLQKMMNDSEKRLLPWVVLISGVGVDKEAFVNQSWFRDITLDCLGDQYDGMMEELPCASNSCFVASGRILSTVTCEEFKMLYQKASLFNVADYEQIKVVLYERYSVFAEMLRIFFVKEARTRGMNIIIDSFGHEFNENCLVNDIFPVEANTTSLEYRKYNKLYIHLSSKRQKPSLQELHSLEMRRGASLSRDFTQMNDKIVRDIIELSHGGGWYSDFVNERSSSDEVRSSVCRSSGWLQASIVIQESENGRLVAQKASSVGTERSFVIER